MPLESQDAQPWGLAVRKDQPEWAAYMSTMVKKWEKDGTIVDLETNTISSIRSSRRMRTRRRPSSGN